MTITNSLLPLDDLKREHWKGLTRQPLRENKGFVPSKPLYMREFCALCPVLICPIVPRRILAKELVFRIKLVLNPLLYNAV